MQIQFLFFSVWRNNDGYDDDGIVHIFEEILFSKKFSNYFITPASS
jgi:hypothetical protein